MIYVVGIGPGNEPYRTPMATQAIVRADVLVGYQTYIDLVRAEFPDKPVFTTGMTGETARCREAIRLSAEEKTVAVLCSGDASVYGMASLVLELADAAVEIEIVPGITAALCASAVLGAPLSGDLAIVSLSDLLTPKTLIERRLRAAAMGDFCIVLYNPSSKKRSDYLAWAAGILLETRRKDTHCGWVRNIAREGQQSRVLSLEQLKDEKLDMFTTVIIGNTTTYCKNDRLITPRGYHL